MNKNICPKDLLYNKYILIKYKITNSYRCYEMSIPYNEEDKTFKDNIKIIINENIF